MNSADRPSKELMVRTAEVNVKRLTAHEPSSQIGLLADRESEINQQGEATQLVLKIILKIEEGDSRHDSETQVGRVSAVLA